MTTLATTPCLHHSAPRRARLNLARIIALYRSRTALARLDADQLDDVGLTFDDAHREARRPVWDVPNGWHY